jgi:hypothetical protein
MHTIKGLDRNEGTELGRSRLRSLYRTVHKKDRAVSLIRDIVENTEAFIRKVQESDSVLNNTIEPYPDLNYVQQLKQFAVSCYWTGSKIVNIFEVVGTADPDYIGSTWITMLRLGQRMAINLPLLQKNPAYYLNVADDKLPDMHYTRINGKLYISGEGNHRTSIAKALFAFLGLQNFGAVKYEEYQVDEEALSLYTEASQILAHKAIQIQPVSKNYKREDTPGWFKDYFDLSFKLTNVNKGQEIRLDKEELKILLREIEHSSWLQRVLKRGKYGEFLF